MKKVLPFFLTSFITLGALAQTPAVRFSFEEAEGHTAAVEAVSGANHPIRNNFSRPERVAGIEGKALRLDGFSTWVEASSTVNYGKHFSFETWVALESYPSDAEVPFANLTPSALISQTNGVNGFQVGVNTFGNWYFRANISGQMYTCQAKGLFPVYQWVHVAAVVDGAAGSMKVYLNGAEAGAVSIPVNGELNEAAVPLLIGKSNSDRKDGIFLLNALNGAIDETRFYTQSLDASTILSHYQAGAAKAASLGIRSLEVPAERFALDVQRPKYHALPPANWTNEPHGLVRHNGQYHMFYQRTPNGPFKTQMHWGHLVSPDLVTWTNVKDALWPSLQWSATSGYDMKGIWSGDVVMHQNKGYAFYTNVNHSGSYNPGIALATSTDPALETWVKHGPIIGKEHVNDFRDPFLWQEGGTWHMLIGAALSTGGGLAYYTSTDLLNWTYNPTFTSIAYRLMDIGSAIWEMPVFAPIGNGKHILVVNPIGGSVNKYGPGQYTRAVYWTGVWQSGRFAPDYSQPKMLDVIHGHLSPTIETDYNNETVGIGIVDERRSSQAQLNAGWAHLFSLPRTWYLMPDGRTLGQKPLAALANLRQAGTYKRYEEQVVTATAALPEVAGKSTELVAYVDTTATGTRYGINFRVSPNKEEITSLYYDTQLQKFFLDKRKSSLSPQTEEKVLLSGSYDAKAFGKPYKFQVFIDHSVIDVFINDAAAFSNRIYPTLNTSEGVELFSEGGATRFLSVEGWEMAQAVPDQTPGEAPVHFLRYDFEQGNLAGFTVTGQAFSGGDVTAASRWSNGGPFGQQGLRHLWGAKEGGDAQTGELKTSDFVLGGDGKITFLLGGGRNPDQLYVALVRASDKQVLAKVTGKNQEKYEREVLDGSAYIGTRCYVAVVDQATGEWGHLNIDDITIPYTVATTSLELSKERLVMTPGAKEPLHALTQPGNATQKDVMWSSSNGAVATVNAAGEVTAVSQGTATITATSADGAFSDQATVTVLAAGATGTWRYDFEQGDFGNLIVTGSAFSLADITNETNWGWGGPFNQQGEKHLWGFKAGGDAQTGELRTPEFTLAGDGKIKFLLGGGKNLNTLYVALVRASDHTVLLKATGLNDEGYAPKVLDAESFVGTTCYVKVVDQETGGYGHLNLDDLQIPVLTQVTGIEDDFLESPSLERIRIYPVPAEEAFTLDLSGLKNEEAQVEIFDIQGLPWSRYSVRSGTRVTIPVKDTLAKGKLYLVRVTTSSGTVTKRVLTK
ncbi:GH32 C-terminal domain-containing protein [Rufibacter psychrotolerans]|uniref:GH32 C-terminal domain-containing protein n=1 Tax=Rufibacter psychrotolerans TaxID=2812556 RepID=UPI0019688066|nr:GH32 C-terminal domain-containing protein [Rufibacter sp. SYSU D00308]